jgi:cytochrome c2
VGRHVLHLDLPVSTASRRRPLALASVLLAAAFAAACSGARDVEAREAAAMTGGDPARGPDLLRKYGCQSCHTIPGVVGANSLVGPPLAGIASRSYIAGVLPNAPDNMLRWIQDPKKVDSLTAMPNVGVTPSDARHIAAYLYTLR